MKKGASNPDVGSFSMKEKQGENPKAMLDAVISDYITKKGMEERHHHRKNRFVLIIRFLLLEKRREVEHHHHHPKRRDPDTFFVNRFSTEREHCRTKKRALDASMSTHCGRRRDPRLRGGRLVFRATSNNKLSDPAKVWHLQTFK